MLLHHIHKLRRVWVPTVTALQGELRGSGHFWRGNRADCQLRSRTWLLQSEFWAWLCTGKSNSLADPRLRGNQTVNLRERFYFFVVQPSWFLPFYAVRTTGALGDAHSVLGLGFATGAGLSGRYPVRILLGGSSFARIRVVSSGAL